MLKQNYKTAIATIEEEDRKEQEAFDEGTENYITRQERETPYREADAARLDTNFAEFPTLATDDSFDFAEPNWNDTHDDMQLYHYCDQIRDTLRRRGAEKMPPRDTLNSIEKLLNCSFSERIKVHIVKLTAGKETIDGASRHCLGLYQEDSNIQGLGNSMSIWHTLCIVIGTAPVFNAFLERAWHLNPTSTHFPSQYCDIVDAVRASELDRHERGKAHYADPHNQLELLNEMAKGLRYEFLHTDDASEKSKLANSQVRVLGAMFVLNERLQSKHENAIQDAKALALKP